jgi:hypothetical protein
MGYSWGVGHEPDGPTVDGLSWRWWRRERTVRISENTVAAFARTLGDAADVIDRHPHDGAERSGVCGDCSATTAELRRLAVDLGEWCR